MKPTFLRSLALLLIAAVLAADPAVDPKGRVVRSAVGAAPPATSEAPALEAIAALDAMDAMDALGDPELVWRGEAHALDALPPTLPPAARAAVEAWRDWARETGYRLDLDEPGRVLLLTPREHAQRERDLELLALTTRFFDTSLPEPDRTAAREAGAPKPAPRTGPSDGGGDELPEDPEGREPFPWEKGAEEAPRTSAVPTTWGAGHVAPDTETAVFFELAGEADYGRLVDALADRFPYLASWVPTARKQTGFTLERPLAGAFCLDAEGQEEFDARNELVNRATQLLLMRRFGQLPHWLVQGVAWHAELELLGTVYCFPFRAEFVWATEHTGWDEDLQRLLKARKKDPLAWSDFAAWPRGTYEAEPARLARGFVAYACAEHPGALSPALEALRAFYAEHSLRELGEGKRERDTRYVVPVADQARLLEEHLGDRLLARMTAWWRKR